MLVVRVQWWPYFTRWILACIASCYWLVGSYLARWEVPTPVDTHHVRCRLLAWELLFVSALLLHYKRAEILVNCYVFWSLQDTNIDMVYNVHYRTTLVRRDTVDTKQCEYVRKSGHVFVKSGRIPFQSEMLEVILRWLRGSMVVSWYGSPLWV